MNRKQFLTNVGLGALGVLMPRTLVAKPALHEQFTALLSDLHVSALDPAADYVGRSLGRMVAEILKRDPLPKRVVVFGDIAHLYGKKEDYVRAKALLQPLVDLGAEIVYGFGNHDCRERFYEVFPEQAGKSPVKGRQVSFLPAAGIDILMLDSLDQPPAGDGSRVKGELGREQGEWLLAELPKWKKPVLVCAHHSVRELAAGDKPLLDLLYRSENVIGFVHGHNHFWKKDIHESYSPQGSTMLRELSLPSSGFWGDIGYGWMQSSPAGCLVEVVEREFYYPRPKPSNERPGLWAQIVRENTGDTCEFRAPRVS